VVVQCCAQLKVPTSSQRIEIYLEEARTFLGGGLSSTQVETIIYRPEDSKLTGGEKFSTSVRRMQFFLGKFQLSGRRIDIYIAEPQSFLLKWLSSTLVETIIVRPEDSMLPCLEPILHFQSEYAISPWKVSAFHTENCDQLSRM